MAVTVGTQFGHYEIFAPLGAGGMGEVYLAEDTRLRRKVALKLLPEAYTRDVGRVRRFEQEARAASALNHPNIITIFEIGVIDQAHFIATEFIDGQTLREHLKAGPVARSVALDFAIQTAAALAAAHEAGIVHRDIKPENVMARRDGIVKVLDFGLAKLTEMRPVAVDSEAPTVAQVKTDPGTVLGTANYMSPEQARGQEVDARSDIFSFGVVLYEMLVGRAPFAGANAFEVIGAILNQEPPPLAKHLAAAPPELQRIVSKALRKDREQRYQHSKDLLLDLEDLKQELEFEAKLKGAQAFAAAPSGGLSSDSTQPPESGTTNAQATDAATNEVAVTRTSSSAEIILGEIKRHRAGVMIGLAVLLACIVLLAYGLYRFATPKQTAAPFQNVKFTRLTSVGNVKPTTVSVSPDGKFIAYVQSEGGQDSLWTKAIATGSTVQIVAPAANALLSTTFSPDGNYVYFQRQEGQRILYQIPAFGGPSKKVITGVDSLPAFSPNSNQFAFTRRSADQTKSQLFVANADGSGERILAERTWSEQFRNPSWSPDGKTIAAIAFSATGNILDTSLLGIEVESGAVHSLVQPKHDLQSFNQLKWFKDGKGLALVATEKSSSSNYQIWYVAYPSGEVRRITNDLLNYPTLSLTADNSAIVTDQTAPFSHLWIAQLSPGGRVQQITSGNNREGTQGVSWTPEGRIVYTSLASGNLDVWIMNADGSNPKQLTDDVAFDYQPVVTPDGRYLVFASTRASRINLWRTDLDGSNPKQLTTADTDTWFDLSPVGGWVVYTSRESGVSKLFKVSLEGGSPVPLYDSPVSKPAISPDGKLIACLSSASPASQRQVILLPFEGGTPVKALESNFAHGNATSLHWTPDGRALLYVDGRQGSSNIWRLPIDGSAAQPATNFNDAKLERIVSFDISRDGKQLIIARGSPNADVVLISEVK